MNAILIVSHGSHSPKTKQEVQVLVAALRKKKLADFIEFAFLEIEKPSIPEGIESLVSQGAKEIKVLLNFLNSGKHVDIDIPQIVRHTQKKHPHVRLSISRPVGQHSKAVDLFSDLAAQTS